MNVDLSQREALILAAADTPNLRVERGEFRAELPRLEALGLGAFGRNNPDRWFLSDAGRDLARSYRRSKCRV